jgi:simple sugar transport system ATP-binding protein
LRDLITHNVRHAHAIDNTCTVLNRGKTPGTRTKGNVNLDELQNLMAGGKELQTRSAELGGTI